MINGLYFKTTCNIRPQFVGPMGGLKIDRGTAVLDRWPLARAELKTFPVHVHILHVILVQK